MALGTLLASKDSEIKRGEDRFPVHPFSSSYSVTKPAPPLGLLLHNPTNFNCVIKVPQKNVSGISQISTTLKILRLGTRETLRRSLQKVVLK